MHETTAITTEPRGAVPAGPGLRDYWSARGRGAFWVTQYLGYSIGALLAPVCRAVRLTPNMVTVIGFLAALAAVAPVAAGWFASPVSAGAYLALMLSLSFGFDCADGILARVTRRSSPFGMLWDKVIDLVSLYTIAAVLGFAARNDVPQIPVLRDHWDIAFPMLMIWSVAPKSVFSVFGWLKDHQVNGMSRTAGGGRLSAVDRVRRFAGNIIDEPVFRLGLGLAWALGSYWEYVILYHGLVALLLVGYVADTWRKMASASPDGE